MLFYGIIISEIELFIMLELFCIFLLDRVNVNVWCLFSRGIIDVIFCFKFLYYLLEI